MALEYKSETKSYSCLAKSDEKDRIEVEVGDSKQNAKFYPQVKVMRWDNECNVSIRLKDDRLSAESESKVSDKVVWTKGQKEVEFYELPASEELPEGGFEFNIILKEKPDTNVIEFTLQDKDVEYLYQPELTQEEIDAGHFRPENVIGSYAIYAKEKRLNIVGGKEYKCGKVGHIYRPKITDGDGKEIWGELDVKGGILTLIISQDFLDKATYPVYVDPTLGYTTTGATDYQLLNPGDNAMNRWTIPAGYSTGSKMTIAVRNKYGDAIKGKAVIWDYSDDTVATNGIGGETSSITGETFSWWDSTFSSSPTLVGGDDYWLGVMGDGGGGSFCVAADSGGTSNYLGQDVNQSYSSPKTLRLTFFVTVSDKVSIYLTYTESAGAVVLTNVINMVIASD